MFTLSPVDRLEVQVLVDDVADPLSSVPDYAESEMGYLLRTGRLPELSVDRMCTAAHGLSCLVTAYRGEVKHTVLFDVGPNPEVLLQNCQRLGVDLKSIDAVVLSHGHIDHGGALLAALDAIVAGDPDRKIDVFAHPDAFRHRAMALPNGLMLPFEDIPDPETLLAHRGVLHQEAVPQSILDDMFCVSGEIPRTTPFEIGFPGHFRTAAGGDEWEPDPLIRDEHFLAANVAGKGLIVFSGCSHAGIINILRCASSECPETKVYGVFGGLHLAGMTEQLIEPTVEAMRAFTPQLLAVGHCTGWRAVNALSQALGDNVVAPMAVGERYIL